MNRFTMRVIAFGVALCIIAVALTLVPENTQTRQPTNRAVPTITVTPPPAADGGNSALHAAPVTTAPKHTGAASWYVHDVWTTNGQNIAPLLNHWGDTYHVWPVGLAATAGVESALNPYAERWAGGLDNSCGLLQQIVTNVAYYTGIQDARAACNWEEQPSNSVYLGARIYSEYFAYQHNCVRWPWAYGMYNAGAGYPCSFYYNPGGDVAAHLSVFMGWYNYALARWAGGSPPAPPKKPAFPRHKWSAYRARHHLRHISSTYHGKRRFEASLWWHGHVKSAGAIVSRPQYFKRPRHSYMTTRFEFERLYWWIGHPHWVKWIRVHAIT